MHIQQIGGAWGSDDSANIAPELEGQLALLETLFVNAPVGFAFVDRAFRYVRINNILAAAHSVTAEDHLGKTVREVLPGYWSTLEPYYLRAIAGETLLNCDVREEPTARACAIADQPRRWLVNYYPVRLRGEIIGVGVIVSDVTEYKKTEDALSIRTHLYAMLSRTNQAVNRCQSREALYQEVCTIATETGRFCLAWIGVPDGNRVRIVASSGPALGYLSEAVFEFRTGDPQSRGPVGRSFETEQPIIVNDFLASPMTAPWHDAAVRAGVGSSAAFPLKEGGQTVAMLSLYAGVHGFFTSELVATLGEMVPTLSFALDALVREKERQSAEASLRLRDRALAAVAQGIVITDPAQTDNPIIYASPGFELLTGYSAAQAIGRNCRFLQGRDTDPHATAELRQAIAHKRACTVQLLNYRKDGTGFWSNLTIAPVMGPCGQLTHFVGVQTDVTQRRNLEEQARQSQKMEAIGQLAGGLAHDFNNLITVIRGYAEMLLHSLPPSDPAYQPLHQILNASDRSAALTRQLLAFSRTQVLAPRVVNLNEVVSGMEIMVRRIIGEDVQLAATLAQNLGRVLADSGQIEQILLNLAVNSRDAMPLGGKLTIETRNVALDESYTRTHTGVPAGQYVMLVVSDSGHGMDREVQGHVFEPFFTTKPLGKGTGLGLSVVHGIVKQSGGHIEIYSEPDLGTCFKIYFPRVDMAAPAKRLTAKVEPDPRGTETVLVVEDETALRDLARQILVDRGYAVLDAPHARQALKLAANYRHPIHLLVTDVVMPGTGGRPLAEKLRELRPEIKVLYVSGYTDDAIVRHGVLSDEVNFLQKPFSAGALAQKVRSVLDQRRPEEGKEK